MCFSGGPDIPVTPIEYEKPDFGPLPSLSVGEPVARAGAQYGQVRTGQQRRSLLMPFTLGGR